MDKQIGQQGIWSYYEQLWRRRNLRVDCSLYFTYIYILSTKYSRNRNGTYRDDGLGWFENVSGS